MTARSRRSRRRRLRTASRCRTSCGAVLDRVGLTRRAARRRGAARAVGVAARAGRAGRGTRRRRTVGRPAPLRRRARAPGRRRAPADGAGRHAGVAARREGPGVGRGVPGRPGRRHAADPARRGRPTPRSRRSAACSTSASPGRGGSCRCPGRCRAQPGGGRRRRRSRFLYGLIPDEHPAARDPDRRRARAAPAPSRAAGSAASRCSATMAHEAAPLRRLPVRCGRRAARPAARTGAARAAKQQVPAYVVFTDATLTAIAEQRPADPAALVAIPGIGASKLDRYGAAVLGARGATRT